MLRTFALLGPLAPCALLLPGCGADATDAVATASEASSSIVGGTALSAAEVEARGLVGLVAVRDGERRGFCSGTLVADRWLLTAAHCERTPRGAVTWAIFGVDLFDGDREAIPIVALHRHPTADLALAHLASPAPARYARVPIVSRRARSRTGETVELAGFGRRDANAPATGGRADTLPAIAVLAEPGSPLVSVTTTGRSGACFGDSGGPVYVRAGARRAVLGVLSNGNTSCTGGDNYVSAAFFDDFVGSTVSDVAWID